MTQIPHPAAHDRGLHKAGQTAPRLVLAHVVKSFGAVTALREVSMTVLPGVPSLSVPENIFAARQPTRGGLIDRESMNRRSRELLGRSRVAISPNASLGRSALDQPS